MSSAIKSSMIKYGVLFLLIFAWTLYSPSDRPAHVVGLLFVIASFAKRMYFLRPIKVRLRPYVENNIDYPARTNFDTEDTTDLARPTVLRRQESHLRVV
jgi:hypothetical protein